MVAYHAADLLWATRIKKTGEDAGVECRPVRSVEMLRARIDEGHVRGLVVDLESPEMSLELVRALRGGLDPDRKVKVLAFGPHVAVELFEQARAAGADSVMARGGFDRSMGEILKKLETHAG